MGKTGTGKVGAKLDFVCRLFLMIAATLCLGLCACQSFPADGRMIGEWAVDVRKTRRHNSALAISPLALALLQCSAENTRLMMVPGRMRHVVQTHHCAHGEKQARIEGMQVCHVYTIVAETESMTTLDVRNPDAVASTASSRVQLHWLSDDSFWVEENYDDHHRLRYYYFRKRQ